MLFNYPFCLWSLHLFNSCTCISMSCHTATIITFQRLLCYCPHAFCFPPLISPDFARRSCPELSIKMQQHLCSSKKKQKTERGIIHIPFTLIFYKQNLSICLLCAFCSLLLSACPLKHVCSSLLWLPDKSFLAWYFTELAIQNIEVN